MSQTFLGQLLGGKSSASLSTLGRLAKQALAETHLDQYIQQAWHVLEPKTPLQWGWHLDAICDHLQAVTAGDIRRLIINIPPRETKSLAVSVMWPTWEWGPQNLPHTKWLFSSYGQDLATRDSLKCRRLIQSDWYQSRWGDRFKLTGDQNQKTRFENDHFGYRLATSVEGVATGEGGDKIVVDDPHNVQQAESDLKRMSTLRWWDESMSSRGNDPNTAAFVVVMQRVHAADLSGHIIAKELGYTHLCLPARYEGNRVVSPVLGFKDPRTKNGEPLHPERFSDKSLKELRKTMTEHAWAGQQQQRPQSRGGGLFKIDKLSLIDTLPENSQIKSVVRYWDKAGTKDGGAYSAGVLMMSLHSGRYAVADVKRGQWGYAERERRIEQTAQTDNRFWITKTWTEQEPGSGGKESAERTVAHLRTLGFAAEKEMVTGAKEVRAEPFSAAVENGLVDVLVADWTEAYIAELESAPAGRYKDQWDAAAGAFNKLTVKKKRAGVW